MFVQGSRAFAMFLANALRECTLFRNTTCYTYARVQSIAFAFEHRVFACMHCVATSNIDHSYGHLRKQAHQSDKRFHECP